MQAHLKNQVQELAENNDWLQQDDSHSDNLFPTKAQASHLWGFEITYECIDSCDVRVTLRAIRDCQGANTLANAGLLMIWTYNQIKLGL